MPKIRRDGGRLKVQQYKPGGKTVAPIYPKYGDKKLELCELFKLQDTTKKQKTTGKKNQEITTKKGTTDKKKTTKKTIKKKKEKQDCG